MLTPSGKPFNFLTRTRIYFLRLVLIKYLEPSHLIIVHFRACVGRGMQMYRELVLSWSEQQGKMQNTV